MEQPKTIEVPSDTSDDELKKTIKSKTNRTLPPSPDINMDNRVETLKIDEVGHPGENNTSLTNNNTTHHNTKKVWIPPIELNEKIKL